MKHKTFVGAVLAVLVLTVAASSRAVLKAEATTCASRSDAVNSANDNYDETIILPNVVNARLYANASQQNGDCFYSYRLVMWGTDAGNNDDGTCTAGGATGGESVDANAHIFVRVWARGVYKGTWGAGTFQPFLCPQQVTTPAFDYGPAGAASGPQSDNAGSYLSLDGQTANAYVNY